MQNYFEFYPWPPRNCMDGGVTAVKDSWLPHAKKLKEKFQAASKPQEISKHQESCDGKDPVRYHWGTHRNIPQEEESALEHSEFWHRLFPYHSSRIFPVAFLSSLIAHFTQRRPKNSERRRRRRRRRERIPECPSFILDSRPQAMPCWDRKVRWGVGVVLWIRSSDCDIFSSVMRWWLCIKVTGLLALFEHIKKILPRLHYSLEEETAHQVSEYEETAVNKNKVILFSFCFVVLCFLLISYWLQPI